MIWDTRDFQELLSLPMQLIFIVLRCWKINLNFIEFTKTERVLFFYNFYNFESPYILKGYNFALVIKVFVRMTC